MAREHTTEESESLAKYNGKKVLKIAVDFDGVIMAYTKWKGDGYENFDPPVPGAKWALKNFKTAGHEIIIWTTRGEEEDVARYLKEHDIPFDYINKHPDQWSHQSVKVHADVYIDDRAYRFNGDWNSALAFVESGVDPWYLQNK